MSIETLLEAAKFLELQAQQQRAREELELCERLGLEPDAGKQRSDPTSPVQTTRPNHVTLHEDSVPEYLPKPPPALHPPVPAPPPSIPFTVIPIPVVSTNAATPAQSDTHSPPSQHALYQPAHLLPMANGPKTAQPLQPYPGSIVKASQHALLPQPPLTSAQLSFMPKTSPPDDQRGLDGKKRPGGAGTREVHNKLEKNRRAHLKECFETLKKNIPHVDEKKTSNLSVLRSALRYVQTLKRKEKEYEHEMERLAREKISTQQRLAELKNDLSQWMDMIEIERLLRQTVQPEDDQASTSTASEGEDNIDDDTEVEEGASPFPHSLARVPPPLQPELRKLQPGPSLPQRISIPATLSHPHPLPNAAPASGPAQSASLSQSLNPVQAAVSQHTQAVVPSHSLAYGHIVASPSIQQTVITRATQHSSVIQAINHVTQTGPKHIAHIAPSSLSSSCSTSSSAVQLAPGPPAIGHITVHPVAHLPGLYPQPVAIAHTLSQGASALAKQSPVGHQVLTHHPQLVGQTVLNPVTMVTMPSFPVSTLKLA